MPRVDLKDTDFVLPFEMLHGKSGIVTAMTLFLGNPDYSDNAESVHIKSFSKLNLFGLPHFLGDSCLFPLLVPIVLDLDKHEPGSKCLAYIQTDEHST